MRKKRLYHRMAGKQLLSGAARIVATSEHERIELSAAGIPADKLVLRRNGLDLSEFADLPERGAFRAVGHRRRRWCCSSDGSRS
jgi:hypothetical protein